MIDEISTIAPPLSPCLVDMRGIAARAAKKAPMTLRSKTARKACVSIASTRSHLAGDAAVVDEVRESAEPGIDGLEHARDIVFVRHVALNGEGPAAGVRDIVDDARGSVGVLLDVDGDIESARAGQPRDGGTAALAASGDKQCRSLRQRRFFLHGESPDACAKPVFVRETGTPIWIGEFGPVFTHDPVRDEDKFRLLSDQLDLCEAHGASWSIWADKDIRGEGPVCAAPDLPWKRIKPVVDKKVRLGADSWATTDASIRNVMAPIEEVFARGYPRFDSFPFGQHHWIQTLVRSILPAEPMAQDFGDCFAGVDDESAIALAESFRFGNCVRRQRLAELIASKTGA